MKKLLNAITFLFVLVFLTACSFQIKTNGEPDSSIESVQNYESADQKYNNALVEEPPRQVMINLAESELLNILNLLDEDEKEVKKYLSSNDYWDYDMNGLKSKADVVKLKNVFETTGFPVLRDETRMESGYVNYRPDEERILTRYVVDGIIYQFIRENTTKTFDYSKYKYYNDSKTFVFDGTSGMMFNAYDESYPQRKNVYYGRFITEDYTIAVNVFNCVDIECVDLEQFEWSNDIYTLEKLSKNN